MLKGLVKKIGFLVIALTICGVFVPQLHAEDENRGIISMPVLFFPDGSFIIGANGDESLTDFNGNALFEVLPGDRIVIGGVTNEVPQLPGYPDGLPYEYDPTGPYIIGGQPLVIVNLDGTPAPFSSSFPGANSVYGDDDDIVFNVNDPAIALDVIHGYVVVTNNGADIKHGDGSPLEGGTLPIGSVVAHPNIIVRPGSGSELPAAHINIDGTIHLVPGNTIDLDSDGDSPWVVPEPGTYDPATGLFYPDSNPSEPYPVPGAPEVGPSGIDNLPVIETISVDGTAVYITWPGYISNGDYLSEILAKVSLNDLIWERLRNGERGVVIGDSSATIPRSLGSEMGGSPGSYRFFKRVVPHHGL